jgi:hypothetical protein
MWGKLGAFASQRQEGVHEGRTVGLAEEKYIPANLLGQIEHAMGDTVQIRPKRCPHGDRGWKIMRRGGLAKKSSCAD